MTAPDAGGGGPVDPPAFRARATAHPIPFDAAAGRAALEALAPPSDVAALVAGAAGCSPYLAGLMRREGAWLCDAWDVAPEAALDGIVEEMARGEARVAMRRAKRRAALLVGLAELGGVWSVMEAAAAWTRFADATVQVALDEALARLARPPVVGYGGLVAMAMGKMGAGELNYSSDVDLVLLFDETRYDPADYGGARAILLKVARRAMATLSEITAEGYVFRTDLRLRPDPGSTPIVMSMEAAERYYEAMGRTWERAAWIKARPAAGDLAAGARFLDRLRPFVWRRHLDFAAVRDAHDMRLRIRDHKGYGRAWDVPGHDVKLGQGGIREIEFLAQTGQLVHGGRDTALRVRPTLDALAALERSGLLQAPHRATLDLQYRHLRRVEHRLQMVQDAQTHRLPSDADGLRRIACFMGEEDGFVPDLRDRLRAVERVVDPAFAPTAPTDAQVPDIEGAGDVLARWETYPALRSARAREIVARLRPALLSELSRAARPAEALVAFDAFLGGLPAGVQVLSLFEANPRLVALIADICATTPDLARHLSRHADVLDAVLDGRFFAPLAEGPPPPQPDPEFGAALDALRRWHREAHFRIGVHLLRALATPAEAARAYADLADAALRAAHAVALTETARRYGHVPGQSVGVFAMGSLGARALTPRSDLDLVVVHDGGAGEVSDGRRALAPGQWAAKFTQTLVTALDAPTGAGRLYEVDMRLRPSGRQGPVAVTLAAFEAYQASEAWVWEHLALTRARPVAGPRALRVAMERARRTALARTRFDRGHVLRELAAMLGRLRAAKPGQGGLDVKDGPGRLQEVELAAQAGALLAAAPVRGTAAQIALADWLPREGRDALREANDLLSTARVTLRLLTGGNREDVIGAGGAAMLANRCGTADLVALSARLEDVAARARSAIDGALHEGTDDG